MTPRQITGLGTAAGGLLLAFCPIVFAGCPDAWTRGFGSGAAGPEAAKAGAAEKPAPPYPAGFSGLPVWDEGLSEMSYYDAVDTLYGRPRRYIRVMLLNREWLNPVQRVKAEKPTAVTTVRAGGGQKPSIPVFKLNIIEEIPTENYNYRYMVTVFLNRHTLIPEKLSASSQEWCGTTFKQLQWLPDGLRVRGFSYFEGEADRTWSLPPSPVAYPREALFVLARAAAASRRNLDLQLLPPMRSTHTTEPIVQAVRLTVPEKITTARVPLGRFPARNVVVSNDTGKEIARLTIEAAAPWRLLAAHVQDGVDLSLRFVERRAYWDRSKTSRFYRQGAAP